MGLMGDALAALDRVALARLYGEPMFAMPTDLYIPPDALEVFLEAFEGPLDLLLYLIRKQNFNILDIPMAGLTRQYLAYIDEVRNHPGKGQGTGFSSYGNWIPGTSGKDFQNRVDQLKSGAFLSAIDELRGMGSLSNAEGQTATAAITRMDTATCQGEFNAALADFEEIV